MNVAPTRRPLNAGACLDELLASRFLPRRWPDAFAPRKTCRRDCDVESKVLRPIWRGARIATKIAFSLLWPVTTRPILGTVLSCWMCIF